MKLFFDETLLSGELLSPEVLRNYTGSLKTEAALVLMYDLLERNESDRQVGKGFHGE